MGEGAPALSASQLRLLPSCDFQNTNIFRDMENVTASEDTGNLANIDLKEAFEMFDADDDGEITLEELQKIMNIHGFFHSDQEMAAMIENVDKNRNGTVDFEEFLEMMVNINESLADHYSVVAKAFQVFDMNGDGLITAEEIRETMRLLGESVSEDDIREMVVAADSNGDGLIDFSEFSNLFKNTALFETERK